MWVRVRERERDRLVRVGERVMRQRVCVRNDLLGSVVVVSRLVVGVGKRVGVRTVLVRGQWMGVLG